MRKIYVEKVTLNIGVGEPGEKLEKAMKLLAMITNAKPVATSSKKRIPAWNIRPKLPIACKVTLRKEKAKELLARLLKAIGKLPAEKFDNNGNFSFGIHEYIDIPGVEYSTEIGMFGLDVAVTLARPGYRIKYRRLKKKKIPKEHRISKEEAMEFIKKEFGIEVV